MFTKPLLLFSAAFMALMGLMATFLPQEMLAFAGALPDEVMTRIVQLLGALHLVLAMLNWMARDFIIGGIYNRPIAMANFLHFIVAGMALAREVAAGQTAAPWLVVTAVYVIFSIWFALVLFTHPGKKAAPTA